MKNGDGTGSSGENPPPQQSGSEQHQEQGAHQAEDGAAGRYVVAPTDTGSPGTEETSCRGDSTFMTSASSVSSEEKLRLRDTLKEKRLERCAIYAAIHGLRDTIADTDLVSLSADQRYNAIDSFMEQIANLEQVIRDLSRDIITLSCRIRDVNADDAKNAASQEFVMLETKKYLQSLREWAVAEALPLERARSNSRNLQDTLADSESDPVPPPALPDRANSVRNLYSFMEQVSQDGESGEFVRNRQQHQINTPIPTHAEQSLNKPIVPVNLFPEQSPLAGEDKVVPNPDACPSAVAGAASAATGTEQVIKEPAAATPRDSSSSQLTSTPFPAPVASPRSADLAHVRPATEPPPGSGAPALVKQADSSAQSSSSQAAYDPLCLGRKGRQLSKFSGDVTEFDKWMGLFNLFVDSTPAPTIEKFNILRNSLTGPAKEAIRHLKWEDRHYDLAKEILRKKFGDSELARKQHFNELDKIVDRGMVSNAKLESFSDSISLNVKALVSLDVRYEEMTKVMTPRVLKCLPPDLRERFVERFKSHEPSNPSCTKLEYLLVFLEDTVINRRDAEWNTTSSTPHNRSAPASSGHPDPRQRTFRRHHNQSQGRGNHSFFAAPASPRTATTSPASQQQVNRPRNNSQPQRHSTTRPQQQQTAPPRPPTVLRNNTRSRSSQPEPTNGSGENQQPQSPSTCVFCEGSHMSFRCRRTLSQEERKERLASAGACSICLKRGHNRRSCTEGPTSGCPNCNGHHYLVMCPSARADDHTSSFLIDSQISGSDRLTPTVAVQSSTLADPEILLQMAVVWAEVGSRRLLVRILLDTGTHRSYVDSTTVKRLRSAPIAAIKTSVKTLGNVTTQLDTSVHRLVLRSRHLSSNAISVDCIETPLISDSVFPGVRDNLGLEPVADTSGDDDSPKTISIIIGAVDLAPIHTGSERVFGRMLATSSVFGWLFSGVTREPSPSQSFAMLSNLRESLPATPDGPAIAEASQQPLLSKDFGGHRASKDSDLNDALRFLWEGELIGLDPPAAEETDSLIEDLDKFFEQTTVRHPEGYYELCLPFKEDLSELSNNKALARSRLTALIRKLRKKEPQLTAVDNEINKCIQSGFAEPAPPPVPGQLVSYLPLQAVFKWSPDGSQIRKCRIVKDASSHSYGRKSLNDCLYQGANLLPLIPKVLIAFRECAFPVTSDIQNAFLQFRLNPSNRHLLRFLFPLGISTNPNAPVQEFVSTRLEFGLTCSPYCHIKGVKSHLKNHMLQFPAHTEFLTEVSDNLYMDDVVFRANSVAEATQKVEILIEAFQSAHFPLKKWSTSNDEIAEFIRRTSPVEDTEITVGDSDTKFLGVKWNQLTDEIGVFSDKALAQLQTGPPSKRTLLKSLAQIYDPVGILSAVTVRAKVLFQTLWKKKIGWDDPLPPNLLAQYEGFRDLLQRCAHLSVSRPIAKQFSAARFELHAFSDASLEAFGCCVYLRTVFDNQADSRLVLAKVRVAPLKNKGSIHRLELQGAVLGAKLVSQARSFMKTPINRIVLWTDNMACLAWIRSNPERWQPFVANRVRTIQQLVSPEDFFYVRSAFNPSDIVSRGADIDAEPHRDRWFRGPPWLLDPEWSPPTDAPPIENTTEESRSFEPHVFATVRYDADNPIDDLIDARRFSSWHKLVRALAWCNRLKNWARDVKLKRRTLTGRRATLRSAPKDVLRLEVSELQTAEMDVVRRIQARHFATEFKNNCQNISSKSPLYEYAPFIDQEGVIRCRSRLQKSAELPFETRNPILIPSEGGWAKLLILKTHAQSCWHWGGLVMTLQELRKRFLIIKARKIAREALRSCSGCRRFNASNAEQPTATLPAYRIEQSAPYNFTGIDFAGPMWFRTELGKKAKGYLLIFCCAVTRAVHAELTFDLSTYEVLRALQKFLHLFPTARHITSDNGASFHRADKELKLIYAHIKDGDIADWLTRNQLTWTFITPKAPWVGAQYERAVGMIKRCLRKALGTSIPYFRDLEVILAGVTAVVNRRPLTTVSTDPDELIALTPACLVSGYWGDNMIPQSAENPIRKKDIGAISFSKRWLFQQRMLAAFWDRYRTEYLAYLRTAHQQKPRSRRALSVGMVCLLKDDDKSRAFWPLVRITELLPGSDGVTRSCVIRTGNGSSLTRPTKLLYPLVDETPESLQELRCTLEDSALNNSNDST